MRKILRKISTAIIAASLICVSGIDSLAGVNLTSIEAQAADVHYTYFPKCNSRYTSFVDALDSIDVDSCMSSRVKIAALNGIHDYAGLASQDMILLDLLKKGKLVKSKYLKAEAGEISRNIQAVKAEANSNNATVSVSEIYAEQNEITVYIGEMAPLYVHIKPYNASDKSLKWSSDNTSIAQVQGTVEQNVNTGIVFNSYCGYIKGIREGKTYVKAKASNGQTISVLVKVEKKSETNTKIATMVARLRLNRSLGLSEEKKYAIASMAEVMLKDGYEPEFVAGVLGNIIHEGNVGQFESSNYAAYPQCKPKYLKYMDGEYDYARNFSGNNITKVSLVYLSQLMSQLESDNWNYGKFGLGCVQWTGSRTKTLVDIYLQYSDDGYFINLDQATKAEGKMLSTELSGNYSYVYNSWKNQHYTSKEQAAFEAGKVVCIKYEVPSDRYYKAEHVRGPEARKVYRVMMGK